ncbi:MAG: four helix bundle protein [Thermomicrobiales bacterium]
MIESFRDLRVWQLGMDLAEGHTRESTKEYLQAISVARGSLAEVETQCELAVRFGYLKTAQFEAVKEIVVPLGKQLASLRNALERKLDRRP